MGQIKASSPANYVNQLSPDEKKQINALRKLIKANLQPGFEEAVNWGMLVYQVPVKRCSETYNGQPLTYVGLAAQKNYLALYLLGIYSDEKLRKKFESHYKKSGKKLNMGKACLRFKSIDEIPVDVIAESINLVSVDDFINMHSASMAHRKNKKLKKIQ